MEILFLCFEFLRSHCKRRRQLLLLN
jgi:hypothetical protein